MSNADLVSDMAEPTRPERLRTENVEIGQQRRLGRSLERSGLPILLVLLIAFFALLPATGGYFITRANINNVLGNETVTALVAFAMVIPLVAGYFDLSAAAIAGVANVAAAAAMAQHGQGVLVAMVAGVVFGVAAGGINAGLIAGLNLDPFITTFGTYVLWSGALDLYTGGQTIDQHIPLSFSLWTTKNLLGVPRPFWILVVVAIVLWFLLTQTPFGRRLSAIGSNERAAQLAGIRTRRAVAISYVLSGLLAGGAGALLTSQNGGGDATTAIAYLFPALAAVFLGRTAIDPGHYNVWGTVLGVFLVAVAVDGITLLGASGSVTQVFDGGAIIVSVGIATFAKRVRESKLRKALRDRESLHSA